MQKDFALFVGWDFVGRAFARGIAVPAIVALNLGNAFAGDGVRDDDRRFSVHAFCFAYRHVYLLYIMPVHLLHMPVEGLPLCAQGFKRHDVFGNAIYLNVVPVNNGNEICKALFPCWRWTEDLDCAVTENERKPKESYLIWVRDREEADEELKNLSANDIKRKKLTTQTLLERMIHGRKFFKETGRHLDISTRTLCAGSRFQDSDVPGVDWYGCYSKVRVGDDGPGDSGDDLRSRQVVS